MVVKKNKNKFAFEKSMIYIYSNVAPCAFEQRAISWGIFGRVEPQNKLRGVCVMETMVLDPKTLIVKSNDGEDLLGVIDFVNQKKREDVKSFLTFASENRIEANGYKFDRNACYAR